MSRGRTRGLRSPCARAGRAAPAIASSHQQKTATISPGSRQPATAEPSAAGAAQLTASPASSEATMAKSRTHSAAALSARAAGALPHAGLGLELSPPLPVTWPPFGSAEQALVDVVLGRRGLDSARAELAAYARWAELPSSIALMCAGASRSSSAGWTGRSPERARGSVMNRSSVLDGQGSRTPARVAQRKRCDKSSAYRSRSAEPR